MNPLTYRSNGMGKSIVYNQPEGEKSKKKAFLAIQACPVGAIRLRAPDPLMKDLDPIIPVDADRLSSVYHIAHHSGKSYGATSFLIDTTQGSVLVDSPRYSATLADRIEKKFGEVKMMVLTHRDDISDHEKWKKRFRSMNRVIHRDEALSARIEAEIIVSWTDDDDPFPLGSSSLSAVFTPGHTSGHICLLYAPALGESALFSGDHLALSEDCGNFNKPELTANLSYNWWSVDKQIESIKKLEKFEFQWLLPGHGRLFRFENKTQRLKMIDDCARFC